MVPLRQAPAHTSEKGKFERSLGRGGRGEVGFAAGVVCASAALKRCVSISLRSSCCVANGFVVRRLCVCLCVGAGGTWEVASGPPLYRLRSKPLWLLCLDCHTEPLWQQQQQQQTEPTLAEQSRAAKPTEPEHMLEASATPVCCTVPARCPHGARTVPARCPLRCPLENPCMKTRFAQTKTPGTVGAVHRLKIR